MFYLDWLMDRKAEFELLVQRQFYQEAASRIDWSAPRLLCIAEDFTRHDIHAIQQINRNIELVRSVVFGGDLLLLDPISVVSADLTEEGDDNIGGGTKQCTTQEEYLAKAEPQLKKLFDAARDHIRGLGDDVQSKPLKWCFACKRLRNFATIQTGRNSMLLWLPLNSEEVTLEDGFSRDVRAVGHRGAGDVELTICNPDDLEKTKPLIRKSFEEN